MAYYCTDCSYRGTTSGQMGECPACGSFKISKAQKSKKEKPRRKVQLGILMALWVYLIALIAWKLSS
jgi:predicted ATP-dependent serine protease